MLLGHDFRGKLVTLFTVGSILAILILWFTIAQGTILWIYSIAIAIFLIFMYLTTDGYKPQVDSGLRPEITVIIPAKNEEEVIESVVRTVFSSDYPSSKMDVIVVDDGSTDRTWERVNRLASGREFSDRLTLIRHDGNYGKRIALASAISRAHSEVVVCIDSDSFVEPEAIKLLVQPFQGNNVVAVCGHGEAINKDEVLLAKIQHFWYAEMFRLIKGMESRLGCVSCCSGMLAAYRRMSILPLINQWLSEKPEVRQIESANEEPHTSPLGHGLTGKLIKSPGEDRILTTFALSAKGSTVVYQSNAVVRTIVPATFRQFMKQQLRWNRAWIHGTVLASRFMWRKSTLASFIFYLYQFIALFSPAVMILLLVVKPLQGEWFSGMGFLIGTLYVGFLHGLNTWSYRKTSLASIPYRMIFVFVSLFLSFTVTLYGWATPWKMGWITRTSKRPEIAVETVPQTVQVQEAAAR